MPVLVSVGLSYQMFCRAAILHSPKIAHTKQHQDRTNIFSLFFHICDIKSKTVVATFQLIVNQPLDTYRMQHMKKKNENEMKKSG